MGGAHNFKEIMGKRYGRGSTYIGDCDDCGCEHWGHDWADHEEEPLCSECERYAERMEALAAKQEAAAAAKAAKQAIKAAADAAKAAAKGLKEQAKAEKQKRKESEDALCPTPKRSRKA